MSIARSSNLLGKITALLIIFCCCLPAQGKYGGGSGTSEDPYQIRDANHMQAIGADANDWYRHFRLMADIDLSGFTGTSFNIIGYYVGSLKDDRPFRGVFDGNGHTISNFSYTSTGTNYIGLFGYIDNRNAKIKNLGLIDPNIDAGTGDYVSSLVGILRRGTITNCYVEGGSVSGDGYVGGLIGRNYEGTVVDCHSVASITGGANNAGGLVGYNSSGTIANSYSSGPISGNGHVGGLVGDNYGTISKCFATGNVSGKNTVGGLVGSHSHGNIKNSYTTGSVSGISSVGGLLAKNHYGTISNCYSTGHVSGENYVGGMLGRDYHGIIMASFWDGETSGRWSSAAGEGKTTSEMKDPNTFISWGSCDDEVVWTHDDGNDYPRLAWEGKPGQPLGMQRLSDLLGGSGTEIDPYIISTDVELQLISLFPCEWDKHFILVNDVNLAAYTGMQFNIIGNRKNPFNGVFDGRGHRIWNFSWHGLINRDYIGLFARLGSTGTIRNLGMENVKIVAEGRTDYMGSLVGLNEGTVVSCYSTGSIWGEGDDLIGGLVGENDEGTITDCSSSASVSGDRQVGGLVGMNDEGTISGCYAEGSVSGHGEIGGLVGTNRGDISNSYATCSVSCYDTSGGLVGTNSYGTISYCYATGPVTASEWGSDIGGLVGDYGNSAVTASFWDIETSGRTWSNGGTGKTTAQMHTKSTFFALICDNEGIWTIDEGKDYPRLLWENKQGELITIPSYGGGSGTQTEPYLIYTAEQLNTIGLVTCHLDKHFLLCADIDLRDFSGTSFNIIGIDYYNPFSGVFDGNGHTISNFTYNASGLSYPDNDRIGLFRYVDGPDAELKNLKMFDPNVDAGVGEYVGALVGRVEVGTISNCYVEGGCITGDDSVGALVGYNAGTITNCYSSTAVSGDAYVGGLVGRNSDGAISNCYVTSSVTGTGGVGGLVGNNNGTINNCCSTGSAAGTTDVGGLVGRNSSFVGCVATITNSYSTGSAAGTTDVGGLVGNNSGNFWFVATITNCYSTGSAVGTTDVGGLVGNNSGDLSDVAIITNCYSTGGVMGTEKVGGLVGYNRRGTITKCYSIGSVSGDNPVGALLGYNEYGEVLTSFWDTETSGQPTSDGGTGLPTAEMQTMSTFTDAGWGCGFIWTIDEGNDYPRLWWENKPGEHIIKLSYCQGTGTEADPYLIYTSEQLNMIGLFSCDWDKHFKLLADIDLSEFTGTSFNIIGKYYYPFSGVFDGNGHKISNFSYTGSNKDYIGFFGYVDDPNAEIKNLGLIDSNVNAGTGAYVGSLAGCNGGNINNCYIEGGSVTGEDHVGGLVGGSGGTITNCYSIGSVSGQSFVGGLVGWNLGTITNCYSAGAVSGNYRVGGLIGEGCRVFGGCTNIVWNSFWDIEISGQATSVGGTGLPTAEMQDANTFIDAGWDFVGVTVNGTEDIWFIPQEDYPHLWWQGMQVPMKLTPRTLNCRSEGNWVKAHLTLPQGFTVADVDPDRPAVLHSLGFQSLPLYVFVNKDKVVEIEAAFERQALCSLAGNWPQALTVAGFLSDGNIFLGTSTVRIIHPGLKVIEELAWYWLNEDCVHPDFCNEIDMNRDSLVNLLDYALLMNIEVEFVTDE